MRQTLKNGITLITKKLNNETVTVNVTVKVGSNNEEDKVRGVSHFIEHMLFEGTKKRDANTIANEVEKLGGDFNAMTSNELTSYYVQLPKQHASAGIEILSDITLNPTFKKNLVDKERNVILEEIKMGHDDPQQYKWTIFYENLFEKHPARYPIAGTNKTVAATKRKDLFSYYHQHYVPEKMVISVAGNYSGRDIKDIIRKFSVLKRKNGDEKMEYGEPQKTKEKHIHVRREVQQTYFVTGVKTVPRKNHDSYVLDVIRSILGRTQSGKLFNEIRTKRGLVYEVGVMHEPNLDYGLFAMYLTAQKKNIPKAMAIIRKEVSSLLNVTDKEMEDAKTNIEGEYLLENDDTKKLTYNMCYWEIVADIQAFQNYLSNVKSVTKADIRRVTRQYLLGNYCSIFIEPKVK